RPAGSGGQVRAGVDSRRGRQRHRRVGACLSRAHGSRGAGGRGRPYGAVRLVAARGDGAPGRGGVAGGDGAGRRDSTRHRHRPLRRPRRGFGVARHYGGNSMTKLDVPPVERQALRLPDVPQWLQVAGSRIVDATGRTVRLTGFGLGGLLNLENFITGYPGNEEAIRRHLRRAMGREAYEAFFEAYEQAFFDRPDAEFIASLGMNSVRVPVNYRQFEDDASPFTLKEEGFHKLDR